MYTAEQSYELALLMLCVYWEARGEPPQGQYAVACVVKNRVLRGGWLGEGWAGVILKPFQFSSFNSTDKQHFPVPLSDPQYGPCLMVSKHVYDGTVPDPTGGATHYYAAFGPGAIPPPAWAATMTKTVTIGNQVFFK